MLKITIHDSASECRFRLEGRLAGEWVREMENCWRTAASTTQGRATTLELRHLQTVDGDGEALLRMMYRAGVGLQCEEPFAREIVERATGAPALPFPCVNGSPRNFGLHRLVPRVCVLLILLLAGASSAGPAAGTW